MNEQTDIGDYKVTFAAEKNFTLQYCWQNGSFDTFGF